MKIRIIETNYEVFFVEISLEIPKGIQMYSEDFRELSIFAFENAINNILFAPEDWTFLYCPDLKHLIIDVDLAEVTVPNPIDFVKILKNFMVLEEPQFAYKIIATGGNPFIDKES